PCRYQSETARRRPPGPARPKHGAGVARCRGVARHGTTTKGAPADFGDWYELEAPEVARTLGVALGDRARAEEATAEAFARAFSRWEQVRVMSSPVGWVYQVALNEARRGFRRRSLEERATQRRGPDPAVVPGPDEP